MCFKDRKAPAAIVAILSVLTLLLSLGMMALTGKLRGLMYELSEFEEIL